MHPSNRHTSKLSRAHLRSAIDTSKALSIRNVLIFSIESSGIGEDFSLNTFPDGSSVSVRRRQRQRLRLRHGLQVAGGAEQLRRDGRVVRLHLGRDAAGVHRVDARQARRVVAQASRARHHLQGGDQYQQQRGDLESGQSHQKGRVPEISVFCVPLKGLPSLNSVFPCSLWSEAGVAYRDIQLPPLDTSHLTVANVTWWHLSPLCQSILGQIFCQKS